MSGGARSKRGRWEVAASAAALNTHNPIRKIVDSLSVEPHPDKPLIALSIGKLRDDESLEVFKYGLG